MVSNFSKKDQEKQYRGADRRVKRWPSLRRLLFGGRRVHLRREEDRKELRFLDHYPATIFGPAVLVVFLSVLDAFLTLFLVSNGAVELNPVMNSCLERGPLFFLTIKYIFTSLAVVLLVIFNHTFMHNARINTRLLLPLAVGIFSAVILWELYLIVHHTVGC